ncbi:MAG TPA: GGDEF domain-containing phosphodiesterase [Baekduia sp.]|nr:GGDEF domain-containing phosphodiesterase [Baekduia sp.]
MRVVANLAASAGWLRLGRGVSKDELTGLPDRAALLWEIERARDADACLLVMNLRGFAELTDTLGYTTGDALTLSIVERLLPVTPGLFAHLGEATFAVLLRDAHNPQQVVAEMLEALARPVAVEGVALSVTAHFGLASFPGGATSASELVRRARVALAAAHRRSVAFAEYGPGSEAHSRDLLTLAADLGRALDDPGGCGLWVAFQPQVELNTGRVAGAEALIRWSHPSRGEVAPHEMLPVAEQTGLVPRLTDWVLEHAVAAAAEWHRAGRYITVSVNVTAGTLVDTRLPERILVVLRRHELPADRLVIEVTEDAIMVDPRRCREVLVQVRRLGVEIAIDDFGTGHSSLAQLKRIPSGELKIDRSFVMGMHDDPLDFEIVKIAAVLGKRLALRVVAEGVEDQDTYMQLAELGCTLAQGFGIGRPMPKAQFDQYLNHPPEIARRIAPNLHAA